MNKVKVLVSMLNFGSFMILMAAIGSAVRRSIAWLKALGSPKVTA
jgi:hypothetical protein